MRSVAPAFLVLIALCTVRDAMASDCRRRMLTDDERSSKYPAHGFRADTYPGEPGVWIAMNIPMALPDARRDVSLAFALLARDGEIPSCAGVNGKRRSLAGLRAEITGGDGNLIFSQSADRYSLEGGFVVVDFERVENAGTRAMCWRDPDIVVTG